MRDRKPVTMAMATKYYHYTLLVYSRILLVSSCEINLNIPDLNMIFPSNIPQLNMTLKSLHYCHSYQARRQQINNVGWSGRRSLPCSVSLCCWHAIDRV